MPLPDTSEYLFSYGTLQLEQVQLAIFADAYEVADYKRECVTLASGLAARAYVAAD